MKERDESKLPKWVQHDLRNLRDRVEKLQDEVAKALNPEGGESPVVMRRGLTSDNCSWDDVPLGKARVVFFPGTEHEIEVLPNGRFAEVRTSQGALCVIPRTANSVDVSVFDDSGYVDGRQR